MSKTIAKKTALQHASLYSMLHQTFDGLISAIDDVPENMKGDGDNGQERKSTSDNGLKYLLSFMLQNIWTQTHGNIVTKNGGSYDNAKQRVEKSEAQLNKLAEENPDWFYTKEGQTGIYWMAVNEQRYCAYDELYQSLASLYVDYFGERWSPMAQKVTKADETKLTEEDKKRIEARMGKVSWRPKTKTEEAA